VGFFALKWHFFPQSRFFMVQRGATGINYKEIRGIQLILLSKEMMVEKMCLRMNQAMCY
jgi:hypothetical protein